MFHEINSNYTTGKCSESFSKSVQHPSESDITINFNSSAHEVKKKSMSEIMGYVNNDKNLPERQINPNDKRPDAEDALWGWINGVYNLPDDSAVIKDIKENRSITTFKLIQGTVSVGNNGNIELKNEESRVMLWKDGEQTTIRVTTNKQSKNSNNPSISVKEYVIDNKSGKLLSEASSLNGKGLRYNFNEDGSFTKEHFENNLVAY